MSSIKKKNSVYKNINYIMYRSELIEVSKKPWHMRCSNLFAEIFIIGTDIRRARTCYLSKYQLLIQKVTRVVVLVSPIYDLLHVCGK